MWTKVWWHVFMDHGVVENIVQAFPTLAQPFLTQELLL